MKAYLQHEGRVIETDEKFKHVMAIALNPTTKYKEGVLRCITSRSGKFVQHGNIDRSELHKIKEVDSNKFSIGERLNIKNEQKIIEDLSGKDLDFLGLEDPDIFIDEKTGLVHLYFTMPFHNKNLEEKGKTYLGHAVGRDLDSLEMTMPVLMVDKHGRGAKEVSIAPLNKREFRFNLVESSDLVDNEYYSTIRVVVAHDMGKLWEYEDTIFHPKESNLNWIAGHASPGPLLPESFIDVGEGKRLGIINGCEANKRVGKDVVYGTFSVGLFIYNYENGTIEWVSETPMIQDSEAGRDGGRAITFASEFVETKPGEGILYAHVDDSFVRAYTLCADGIRKLLPANYH